MLGRNLGRACSWGTPGFREGTEGQEPKEDRKKEVLETPEAIGGWELGKKVGQVCRAGGQCEAQRVSGLLG